MRRIIGYSILINECDNDLEELSWSTTTIVKTFISPKAYKQIAKIIKNDTTNGERSKGIFPDRATLFPPL